MCEFVDEFRFLLCFALYTFSLTALNLFTIFPKNFAIMKWYSTVNVYLLCLAFGIQ